VHNRNVVAIDMEAYYFYDACHTVFKQAKIPCVLAKAITDYAVGKTAEADKMLQPYGAQVSALFLIELIGHYVDTQVASSDVPPRMSNARLRPDRHPRKPPEPEPAVPSQSDTKNTPSIMQTSKKLGTAGTGYWASGIFKPTTQVKHSVVIDALTEHIDDIIVGVNERIALHYDNDAWTLPTRIRREPLVTRAQKLLDYFESQASNAVLIDLFRDTLYSFNDLKASILM